MCFHWKSYRLNGKKDVLVCQAAIRFSSEKATALVHHPCCRSCSSPQEEQVDHFVAYCSTSSKCEKLRENGGGKADHPVWNSSPTSLPGDIGDSSSLFPLPLSPLASSCTWRNAAGGSHRPEWWPRAPSCGKTFSFWFCPLCVLCVCVCVCG